MELSLLLIILNRIGASSSSTAIWLTQQLHSKIYAKCLDKTPVNKNIAPSVAVLFTIVNVPDAIQITGVLYPVVATGICSFTIKLGIRCLFQITLFCLCRRN